jgi:hypothetical protein
MDQQSAHEEISGLIHGYWKSQAVYVAAKLRLADLLTERPRTMDELAEETGAHARSLYRVLRALVSIGIFAEEEDGRFSMTPLAEPLRIDVPGSQWAMAVMRGEENYHVWGDLIFTVETGLTAFDRIYGMPILEFLSDSPEKGRIFDQAMTSIHGREIDPMLAAYDFSEIGTLADIGGGNGSLMSAVLKRYPQMKGILFDLPGVIGRSVKNIEAAGLADRCQTVSGDFFKEVPDGADAYLLRHIIHAWDDEKATTILQNVRKAMKGDSRVLVLDSVIPQGNEPFFGKWLDLTMMLIPGGQERSEEEYRKLFDDAGLRITQILPTSTEVSIIEGVCR